MAIHVGRECITQVVNGSRLADKSVSIAKLNTSLAYLVNGGGSLLSLAGVLMDATHTVNLSRKVSEQRSGVILVFSAYDSSAKRL